MKSRPILFSGPMVRALLDGSKTQTRRVVKGADQWPPTTIKAAILETRGTIMAVDSHRCTYGPEIKSPYGMPGDQLWVREAWARDSEDGQYFYRADVGTGNGADDWERNRLDGAPNYRWKPSIHMPGSASRVTLQVTGVRVERLQDISIEDCKAEGAWGPDEAIVSEVENYFLCDTFSVNPRLAYQMLWERINGDKSWDSNPWVWVIEFKAVKP